MTSHANAAPIAPHLLPGRRASWFELFFDLAFVTVVAQLTGALAQHYDASGFLRFAFLLLVLWWTWLGHTFHATRFDEDRFDQHLLGLLKIAAVVVIGFAAGDAFGAKGVPFALGMAALKALLMLAYLRERGRPQARGLVRRYASIYAVQALLWLASAALQGPAQWASWALWAAVLVLDMASPMVVARQTHGYPPHPEHLPERFALFTIIVMGEGVASALHALLHDGALSAANLGLAALGLALAFLYWIGYYERAGGHHELHVRDAAEGRRLRQWAYGHIPLLLGIAGTASGLVAASAHHASPHGPWLVGASVALAMLGLTVIGAARAGGITRRHGLHLLLALLPAVAAAFGSSALVFGVGAAIGVVQVALARSR